MRSVSYVLKVLDNRMCSRAMLCPRAIDEYCVYPHDLSRLLPWERLLPSNGSTVSEPMMQLRGGVAVA
jgi:hypothetical protein